MSDALHLERVTVRNDSGETAPAYGIAEIDDSVTVESEHVVTIRKPTGTGELVAIGPAPIADGAYGLTFRGAGPFVLYSSGSPINGDTLQVASGSWSLAPSGGGQSVPVIGGADGTKVRVSIGGGGSGGASPPTSGIVSYGTAATYYGADDTLTPGELLIWPLVAIPDFSPTADYDAGDLVILTAAAFDAAASYNTGDLAVESGTVYQANGAITPGAFNAAEWTSRGSDGDTKKANTTITASVYDATEWNASNGTLWFDRTGDTIEAEHRYTTAPTQGAYAEVQNGRWVVLTCDALEGFS